jgi:hypothetical protein
MAKLKGQFFLNFHCGYTNKPKKRGANGICKYSINFKVLQANGSRLKSGICTIQGLPFCRMIHDMYIVFLPITNLAGLKLTISDDRMLMETKIANEAFILLPFILVP